VTEIGVGAARARASEPLTDRILGSLGGPEWLWIALWTGISFVRPVVLFAALSVSGRSVTTVDWIDVLGTQAVMAWITIVGFWGARRISRGARDLAPQLASIAPSETTTGIFPGMTSTAGPVTLAIAIAVVPSVVSSWQRFGPVAALADLPFVLVNALPTMTLIWTYLVMLAGLHTLGRERLSLDPFPEDRSLGLRPVGSLALAGFWLILAIAVPIIFVFSADLPTVLVSLVVIGASVGLFFLSMFRVHRQMVESRHRYLSITRAIYREAYEPVRANPSLGSLEARATALSVAQGLVERAESVLEWPIDERATAVVAVVVTGVVTSLIVRLVLIAAGV